MAYLRSTKKKASGTAKRTPAPPTAFGNFMFIRGSVFKSVTFAAWAME